MRKTAEGKSKQKHPLCGGSAAIFLHGIAWGGDGGGGLRPVNRRLKSVTHVGYGPMVLVFGFCPANIPLDTFCADHFVNSKLS